jgi:hypothetical protein
MILAYFIHKRMLGSIVTNQVNGNSGAKW